MANTAVMHPCPSCGKTLRWWRCGNCTTGFIFPDGWESCRPCPRCVELDNGNQHGGDGKRMVCVDCDRYWLSLHGQKGKLVG